MKTRAVGILGVGHVGAHIAYTLAVRGIVDELLLIDINEQKAVSECQDLRDAVAYLPHRVSVDTASFADLAACDVLLNCVGKNALLETQDRVAEGMFTVPLVNKCLKKIIGSGFHGVAINVTNPCDIITHQLIQGLQMPKGRVFGTGSGLDTSRLLSALARQTGIAHKSISACMLGEHGNAQFVPWSCVSFCGRSLGDWAKADQRFCFDRAAIQEEAIRGGWVTFLGKKCTEYGIAATAAQMVQMVLHDERGIMSASMELDGEYGESGLCIGVPCVIGKNGVEQIVELPLAEDEAADFHRCCESVRQNMGRLIPNKYHD